MKPYETEEWDGSGFGCTHAILVVGIGSLVGFADDKENGAFLN